MNYRPWLEEQVLRQMAGLPGDAFDTLAGILARICADRASSHGFSCIQPDSGAGTWAAAPARSPWAAPMHPESGHLVNATAASAAEANNRRRADLAVIHPRCCHSRPASESPAITTSPNGMER